MKGNNMTSKKTFWATDGDAIEITEINSIVFKNNSVEEFRKHISKHFIVSTKGIGKTILLKAKRYHLEQKYKNKKAGPSKPIFVPADNPYLDYTEDIGDFDQNIKEFLSRYENAKKAWLLALQSSISNYFIRLYHSDEIDDIKEDYKSFHPELFSIIFDKNQVTPIQALERIIFERGLIEKEYSRGKIAVGAVFDRFVRSGIYVFIDRIDQALQDHGKELWISMQAGLLEAAWTVMRNNNHVKIFTSIRLEAFYNYHSSNKQALTGAVTFLDYDHEDLFDMMVKLVKWYSAAAATDDDNDNDNDASDKDEKRFYNHFGIDKNFMHPERGDKETAFDYMLSHTIRRPRDLVVMAANYKKTKEKSLNSIDNFRREINTIANKDIGEELFSEYGLFLPSLHDPERRGLFFSNIHRNILKYDELKKICGAYNNKQDCDDTNCQTCTAFHPFCELYNIGLIGVIKEEFDEKHQFFVPPRDIKIKSLGYLATSDFYFIHPCLYQNIMEERKQGHNEKFRQVPLIPVGYSGEWDENYDRYIELTLVLELIKDPKCYKSVEDILFDLIKEIKRSGRQDRDAITKGIRSVMEKVPTYIDAAGKAAGLIERIGAIAEKITEGFMLK
jgi:hypothetical protein